MFCVIQEIQRKKVNAYGEYRELEAYSPYEIDDRPKYSYQYTGGRFERPIKTAYKISIHESKRVNGVVTKKQYPVTTVDYYSLTDSWIGDCFHEKKLVPIAAALNTSVGDIWALINAKVDPLQERIKAEYQKTKEYKTHARHEKIIKKYQSQKQAFAKGYGVAADEYDYCYNVFGEIMNQKYLDEIIAADRQRQQSYSSYYERESSNYSGYDYSKLFKKASSYSDDEKAHLKKFYRTLSKTYHPDVNQEADATEAMKLLNKLKDDWDI